MATNTASASEDTRGAILIKDEGVIIAWIWCFDVLSVGIGDKFGETQISIRDGNGLWFKTSASPAEVYRAIASATTLYYASSNRKTRSRSSA